MPRIIFYQQKGAAQLEMWMSLNLEEDDIVFERDKYFFRAKRISYEDCLNENDCREIDSLALKFSENWYRDNSGKDLFLYDGVSLGKAVEYKLMKYFVRLIKDIFLLFRLKEKQNPKLFVFIDDNSSFSGLVKEFSAVYGIMTETILLPSGGKIYSQKIMGESLFQNFSKHLRSNIKSFMWNLRALKAEFSRRNTAVKKTIIIEGYGKFITLIKELAERGNRVIVLGRLGIEKGLFHPNIFYKNLVTAGSNISVSGDERKLAGKLKDTLHAGALSRQGCIFDRFDAGTIIIKQLEQIVDGDFPVIISSIRGIKKILMDCHASSIITLQDREGINRILASCANSLGIKTIEIQHGTLSDVPYLVSPISAQLCVWGSASKEFYLKRGVEEERICMVGDPNLERLEKSSIKRIDCLKRHLGLDIKKSVVLFASQPFIEITSFDSPLKTIELFDCVCGAARELKDVNFLIKFHPSEDSSLKMERLKKNGYKNIFVAKKGVANELLSLCDVLITFCSSIVLEACLLDIPVITVNITGKKDFLPIAEMGGAIGVYSKKDLLASIRSVLYDGETRKRLIEGQKKFINSQIDFGKPALERILNVI